MSQLFWAAQQALELGSMAGDGVAFLSGGPGSAPVPAMQTTFQGGSVAPISPPIINGLHGTAPAPVSTAPSEVPVICGKKNTEHEVTGFFNMATRRIRLDKGDMAGQEVTPGEFEKLGGRRAKKWRDNVKVIRSDGDEISIREYMKDQFAVDL